MKNILKNIGALAITLGLALGAQADQVPVEYLAPEYNQPGDPTSGIKEWKRLSTNKYDLVTEDVTQMIRGWWVVTGAVNCAQSISVSGAVHLILADGCSLTVQGNNFRAGIIVRNDDDSLAIYGQTAGTGKLTVTGDECSAGIGGSKGAKGSNITINGGTVEAVSSLNGAGIGGGEGENGSKITINGGSVKATGYNGGAAAIGGGGGDAQGSGSDITINGGTVTANGSIDGGAAIGGAKYRTGSNITINGGTVTAKSVTGAAIGSGANCSSSSSNIKVNPDYLLKAGASENQTEVIAAGRTADTDVADALKDMPYATVTEPPPSVMTISVSSGVTSTNFYASLAKAVAELKNSEAKLFTIVLLKDGLTTEGLALDRGGIKVTIDLNGCVFTNGTCTIGPDNGGATATSVVIKNGVTGQGGLVNNGTVTVRKTSWLDLTALSWTEYGKGGLIPGSTGAFALTDGGRVEFNADNQSPNWMAANYPDFLSQCANGAVIKIGNDRYVKGANGWALDGAVATAGVAGKGSSGQSLEYVESYKTVAAALTAVTNNGTVTMLNDSTEEQNLAIRETVTLDLTADGCTIATNGLVNSGIIKVYQQHLGNQSLEAYANVSGTLLAGSDISDTSTMFYPINTTINLTTNTLASGNVIPTVKINVPEGKTVVWRKGVGPYKQVFVNGNADFGGAIEYSWWAEHKTLLSVTGDVLLAGDITITNNAAMEVVGTVTLNQKTISLSALNATFTNKGGTLVANKDIVQTLGAEYTVVNNDGVYTVKALTKLTNVEIVDASTGVTNATAKVYRDGKEVVQNADGSFSVSDNTPVKIVYTVTENAIFGTCFKERVLEFAGIPSGSGDSYAMTDDDKKSVVDAMNPAWIEGDGEAGGREIALDTRSRIIVASPNDVLPIAYSTNNWEHFLSGVKVDLIYQGTSGDQTNLVTASTENGYYDWTPAVGDYGRHKFSASSVSKNGQDNDCLVASVYYSTYFPLTWSQPEHGTLAVTNEGVAISSPTNVLGYSNLILAATPGLYQGTQERYEFTGWTATTNDVDWTDAFEDPTALTQTLEMPNAATALAGGFQWKSNYTEKVTVAAGDTWEIMDGETYSGGIDVNGTLALTGTRSFSSSKVTVYAGGTNLWDFTGGKNPRVARHDNLTMKDGSVSMILFDDTLTNGTYSIASNVAQSIVGTSFEISDGATTKTCVVGSDSNLASLEWTYVGAKRFKLYRDSNLGFLKFAVEPGIPMALEFAQPEGGTIAASTNGVEFASGTKVLPSLAVDLAFTPVEHWQADTNTLTLVDATNAVYIATNGDFFADVSLDGASFKMTETNATVSLAFMISDAYRAELFTAVTNDYAATTNEIEQLRDNRLTGDETDKALAEAVDAFNTANAKVGGAYQPAAGDSATNDLAVALTAIEREAKGYSDGKPYDLVIADDFAAIADGEVSEDGKFTMSGIAFQTNVNAFTSFSAAYAETTYVPYVTNVYAFGRQTIASEPTQVLQWNLNLVPYTDAEATAVESVLTIEKDLDGNQALINITNNLVKIAGEGTIVLSKIVDEVKPTIYDAIKGEKIVVKNVGVEPAKTSGDIQIAVDRNALVGTNEVGEAAIVLPGIENGEGNIDIVVSNDNAATNDVLIVGKTEAVGKVTISNLTTNRLEVAGAVNASAIQISNKGNSGDAEGLIVALAPIEASGAVTIENDAHLEANVKAGGTLTIYNHAVTTLVGTYGGKEIILSGGDAGAISNAIFTSEGDVSMSGVNILTGEFRINANGSIKNSGFIEWDLKGGNHAAYLADLDAIENIGEGGVIPWNILLDVQQEVGTYVLAGNAADADGKTFQGNDGDVFSIVVNGDFAVRGNFERLYRLNTNDAGELVLTVVDMRTHFEATQYAVREGCAVKVCVWGGSMTEAVQATLTYQRNSGAYSAVYMDGKKVSLPLTLSWAKGDISMKEILFQTASTSLASEDRFFTLQLGSAVGETVLDGDDVCTVTVEDSGVGVDEDYVRALAWPANGGTVSGGGTLVNAKSFRTLTASTKHGSIFAGWFKAKKDNAEEIDLDAPVEPYTARIPRSIRVGYDAKQKRIVNEAGTYFAYFTNVLEVAAVVEPTPFDTEGMPKPGVTGVTHWDGNGIYATMVGVKFAMPVTFEDGSGKGRLSVSKLPVGLSLKYDYLAECYVIAGVPTKAGTYNAQFVASNAAGKHTVNYTFVVEEIPTIAVGTFAGVIGDDTNRTGVGSVKFTAGKTGALSAKVTRRLSGTRSFSVRGYDYIDEDTLGIAMTNAYGEVFEATLVTTNGWYDTAVVGAAFGGSRRGTLGYNDETNGVFAAVRNAFSSSDKDPAAQQTLASFQGNYGVETLWSTNEIEQSVSAVGTVKYRVNAQGNVYAVAWFDRTEDDGKKVSARTFSGTVAGGFTYDETTGLGAVTTALRNGNYLWSATCSLYYPTHGVVDGKSRYIRPNADRLVTDPVDTDQFFGDEQ